MVSLLNICQTDRQKQYLIVLYFIRTVFSSLQAQIQLCFLQGEGLSFALEALSLRSITAPSLCPIQLVNCIAGLLAQSFTASIFLLFPQLSRAYFLSVSGHWNSHCICTCCTPHTESQITIRYTSTQSLPLSHTHTTSHTK